MKAVIMAGGKGTRLRPYTLVLPKPLVPVGGFPVIEILLKWLKRNGVEEGIITLGYLGDLIKAVCMDGSQWGIPLTYVNENEPLSTIGPLKLIAPGVLDSTFLSLNGDIISDLDLRKMVKFHKGHGGILTVATTKKNMPTNLGIIKTDSSRITNFREKPVLTHCVSMGIYCMEPGILDYIPSKVAFGFDDLMYSLLDQDIPVYAYEHDGMWMDIGRPEDYQTAQGIFEENRVGILGI